MRKEQGIAHILLLILLLAGIVAGVYLIQNKTNLFSRAGGGGAIIFKSSTGAPLSVNSQNIPQSTSPSIRIEFSSPLGSAKTSVSGPVNTYTVSYRYAEDPVALDKAASIAYRPESLVVNYTFKNQNPGSKFIWAEFKDNLGKTERRSAQIELIGQTSTSPFSGLSADFAQKQAAFKFNYTGKSNWFKVDASTLKDMSWDVYVDFAGGRQSPVVLSNPTKWDKYACGKTLYWRVYSLDRKEKSDIQTTTINCAITIPTGFSGLSADLKDKSAQFNFTYSGPKTANYRVDMSTYKDMSWDVYGNFGQGAVSPVNVADPQKRWDKYKCGATLYWRIYDSTRKISSSIQTSTINCAISPVVQSVNPASLPSNYAALGQTALEVNGSGFQPGIAVMFYKTGYSGPFPVVNSVTPTQIKVTLSAGMSPGYYSISVQNVDRLGYNKTDVLLITSQIITPPPTPQAAKRVFVTSTTYNGNLGGLAGADSKCQTAANNANLGGTWKAWLSDNTTSAASRLSHATIPYKLINGVTVANNWADLIDGSIQTAIGATERGNNFYPAVWTNTQANGASKGVTSCGNWLSNASAGTNNALGTWGAPGFNDARWTDYTFLTCNSSAALYCFEQ